MPVNAIGQTPPSTFRPLGQEELGICPSFVKVKRYAYYFFSALFFSGAVSLAVLPFNLAVPLLASLASVPVFLCSYYLLKLGRELWDYQDPQELCEIRQMAMKTPLLELISEHGWQNFFLYQFLSPQNFTIAFKHQADLLDTNGAMLMYRRARQGLTLARQNPEGRVVEYTVPELRLFKDRCREEMRELSCDEILIKYNILDLERHGFLSPEEIRLLKELKEEYEQAVRECRLQIASTEGAFSSPGQLTLPSTLRDESEGHEFLWAAHRERSENLAEHFACIKRHLGIEIPLEGHSRHLTSQQREQRLTALFFHEKKLKEAVDRINRRYEDFRAAR